MKRDYTPFLLEMSSQTYSREYLQAVPQEVKQKHIDTIVNSFIQRLLNLAASGEKSYTWWRTYVPSSGLIIDTSMLSDAEIVAGFFERFPGCKIYYEEAWVEAGRDTKTLKKGIVIDWS